MNDYFLDIHSSHSPDHSTQTQKIPICDKVSIGTSPQADYRLEKSNFASIQCVFRVHNGILSLHNMQEKNTCFAGRPLEKDKMYIMEKGDEITLENDQEKITFIIGQNDTSEEPSNLSEESSKLSEEPLELSEKYVTEDITEKDTQESIKEDIKKDVQKVLPSSPPYYTVGPFTRFYALVVNICLAYGILTSLIPFLKIELKILPAVMGLMERLPNSPLEPIGPFFHTLASATDSQIMNLYAIFIFTDVVFHLLLGTSLPLFLTGLRPKGRFLIVRLQGACRSLIGNLTFPLLIFDLPSLFGKRSFKEMITWTRFQKGGGGQRAVSYILLFPILMALGLGASFFIQSPPLFGAAAGGFHISSQKWDSKVFKVEGDLLFIPRFSMGEEAFHPSAFILGNSGTGGRHPLAAHWNIRQDFSLWTFLKKASQGPSLFSKLFPLLAKRVKARDGQGQGLLSLEEQKELAYLLKDSLSLDLASLPNLIKINGPFLAGHVLAQRYVVQMLDITSSHYFVETALIRRTLYLNIHQIQKSEKEGPLWNSYVIPLDRLGQTLSHFTFKSNSVRFAQKGLIPLLERKKKIDFPKDLQSLSPLALASLFMDKATVSPFSPSTIEDITQYYRHVISRILNQNQNQGQNQNQDHVSDHALSLYQLRQSLKEMINFFERKGGLPPGEALDALRNLIP